jgi:hypothetical protein
MNQLFIPSELSKDLRRSDLQALCIWKFEVIRNLCKQKWRNLSNTSHAVVEVMQKIVVAIFNQHQ